MFLVIYALCIIFIIDFPAAFGSDRLLMSGKFEAVLS